MSLKIIIRTPNYIGDTIMMLPALELLRNAYPEAVFSIVCRKELQELFRGKGITEIIIDDTKGKQRLKKTFRLLQKIRRNSYDLGFLFHNSLLTAIIFKFARIQKLIGYQKEGRGFLLDFSLPINRNQHYTQHYGSLVNQFLGSPYKTLPAMSLHTERSQLLEKGGKPLIGFVLGGENKGTRQYPKEQSLQLFQLLGAEDYDFVLLGDNHDSFAHNEYAEYLQHIGKKCQNLTGKTSVAAYIDAVATLDLLVTIDTSAMHIAAATGVPFLLLAGLGTSPLSVVYPQQGEGTLLFKGGNILNGKDMIAAIRPEDIYGKIMEIIDKKVIFGGKSSSNVQKDC